MEVEHVRLATSGPGPTWLAEASLALDGIAPAAGHLLDPEIPSRLVRVTRAPRRTYGDALVDELLAARIDATIDETDEPGRPDVLRLACGAYRDARAEAVVCIPNRTRTGHAVHEPERRGIPSLGPMVGS